MLQRLGKNGTINLSSRYDSGRGYDGTSMADKPLMYKDAANQALNRS